MGNVKHLRPIESWKLSVLHTAYLQNDGVQETHAEDGAGMYKLDRCFNETLHYYGASTGYLFCNTKPTYNPILNPISEIRLPMLQEIPEIYIIIGSNGITSKNVNSGGTIMMIDQRYNYYYHYNAALFSTK